MQQDAKRKSKGARQGGYRGSERAGSYGDVFQRLVLSLGSSFLPAFRFVTGCISCKQMQHTFPTVRPAMPEEPLSQQSCFPAGSLALRGVHLISGLPCPSPGKAEDSPLEGNASSPAIQCTAPTPADTRTGDGCFSWCLLTHSFHLHRADSAQLQLALETHSFIWLGRNPSTTMLLSKRNLHLGQHAGPWAGC